MTVRKNQSALTADEKRRFVAALVELKRSGRYDEFVTTHNAFIVSDTDNGERDGHRSPSFLPWHRRFLLEFERRAAVGGRLGGAAVLGLDRRPFATRPRCGRPTSSAAPGAVGTGG